jgi:hypothetical protein
MRPTLPFRRLPFPTGKLHTRDWLAVRRAWAPFWRRLGL